MEKVKNNFLPHLNGKIEVSYEGKQYDCIKITHTLANGDTDYCRDETWVVCCPKEDIFFKIHDVSFRNHSSEDYTDITKMELNTDGFDESVTGVHTGKL